MNIGTDKLLSVATDLDVAIEKLTTNAPELGRGFDFSQNRLKAQIENSSPLFNWLISTSVSGMLKNALNQGTIDIRMNSKTGDYEVLAPTLVGTVTPEMSADQCCWTPMDLAMCASKAPLKTLCLQDCHPIAQEMLDKKLKVKNNDLIGYFKQPGQTYEEVRKFMARESMAFYTANNVILGNLEYGTGFLKPYHGLLQILEQKEVLHIPGVSPLAAFDMLGCRLALIGSGNYVIAVHPILMQSIKELIRPNQYGIAPQNWTVNGDSVSYNGIRFMADKRVPVDIKRGFGEAWVLDGDTVGSLLLYNPRPEDEAIREVSTQTNNRTEGCFTTCTLYHNMGTVVSTDTNRLAVVTNIPLSTACNGFALSNLGGMVQPSTLVPMD